MDSQAHETAPTATATSPESAESAESAADAPDAREPEVQAEEASNPMQTLEGDSNTLEETATHVDVDGKWAEAMRPTREAGHFLDVTLVCGERRILAHT